MRTITLLTLVLLLAATAAHTSLRRQGRKRSPLYWAGRLWLRVFGWKAVGDVTAFRKYVVVAAPHTSNWDFPHLMAAAQVMGVRASWLGKHTIFAPPWGWFFRRLGGIPVDRSAPQTLVAQLAERFKAGDELILGLAPEGTRGKVAFWKSGFYHIAVESGVPIALGFLDYDRKLCGLGPYVKPTGNVRADMDKIRDFYRNIRARHPEHASEPRLREETQST